MAIIVISQVIMRYVFKSPFIWAEEAARYLLVWIACLGSAYAVKKKLHISVLFFKQRLIGPTKYAATLISHFMVLSFFVLCILFGLFLALSESKQVSPGLGIPMNWVLISIPIGFAVMTLFAIEEFISDISKIINDTTDR